MTLFNFVFWNVSPEIVTIGSWELRYYSILFALGFILGGQLLAKIYKMDGKSEQYVETLTLYMVPATVLGARLGHCLFYDPAYYLSHPIEILKVWEGGLASHGAGIGILIALYLYCRKHKDQSYLYVLDRMVIVVALAGCLIRFGNLMNSEIYGKITDSKMGFLFVNSVQKSFNDRFGEDFTDIKVAYSGRDTLIGTNKVGIMALTMQSQSTGIPFHLIKDFVTDKVQAALKTPTSMDVAENVFMPENEFNYKVVRNVDGNGLINVQFYSYARYPTQIYESLFCIVLLALLMYVYMQKKINTPSGRLFGLFFMLLFTFRFFIEYLKAPQVDFENNMSLNMGQILSIPMVLLGVVVLWRSYRIKEVQQS